MQVPSTYSGDFESPKYDPSLDAPKFLAGDVAAALRLSETLLKAWLQRKLIPMGSHDMPAIGKGSARVFTLRRIISIGIGAELVRLGFSPSRAFAMAFMATVLSIVGDEKLVFPLKYFCAYIEDDQDKLSFSVWNDDRQISEFLDVSKADGEQELTSFAIVNVDLIMKRAKARLAERGKFSADTLSNAPGTA
jgi:hypothetical protein